MANIGHVFARTRAPKNSSNQPSDRARGALVWFRWCATAPALFLFFCVTASVCHAQSRGVICNDGIGDFEAGFRTGVEVKVGAARNGELATRVCEAALNWNKQTLVIAAEASQLDVDAFGVDLGVGVPVVTFQIKKSKAECCFAYKIYSLQKPPRLLRIITGGDFFSAADTDLDGRVEIWTGDAASVEGFENSFLSDLDFVPPVVLRFVHGQLVDVSSEFQPYFDRKVAEERAGLDPQDLRDFKSSDGRLAPTAPFSAQRLYQLRIVKMKVLEIIWSYLYSGREQEAWRSLADLWPPADADRIHTALLNARARGIRAQVDSVSTGVPTGRGKHAQIFDARTSPAASEKDAGAKLSVVPPKPILIQRLPPFGTSGQGLPYSESQLDLVIDSAGKVRSVEPPGNVPFVDAGLMSATAKWKFIPAFSAGRPVASRINLAVSLKR